MGESRKKSIEKIENSMRNKMNELKRIKVEKGLQSKEAKQLIEELEKLKLEKNKTKALLITKLKSLGVSKPNEPSENEKDSNKLKRKESTEHLESNSDKLKRKQST